MSNHMIFWSPGITLDAVERQVIERAFDHFKGNKTSTAIALGVSVRTLDNKFERYKEEDEEKRNAESKRRFTQEDFIRRSRGLPPLEQPVQRETEAPAGVGMEPAADTAAQPPLSMPQRRQVQSVLPSQAAAGGAGKRR